MPTFDFECRTEGCKEKSTPKELLMSYNTSLKPQLCEVCGQPMFRVYSISNMKLKFKGSGFYTTDYKGNNNANS